MKPYSTYWGKAQKKDDGTYDYHPLVYHSLDVAATASVLLQKEQGILKKLSEITTIDVPLMHNFLLFLISLHDIGKFSVTFQNLIPQLMQKLQNKSSSKLYQYYSARHDQLGMFLFNSKLFTSFQKMLRNKEISSPKKAEKIIWLFLTASVGHHGIPPHIEKKYLKDFFDEEDQRAAEDFFSDMMNLFVPRDTMQKVIAAFGQDKEKSSQILHDLKPITWQLAAIITLCDWIASGSDFKFQSEIQETGMYWKKSIATAEQVVAQTGLLPAAVNKKYGFSYLFPEFSCSATPMQRAADEITLCEGPQLFIIEDLTGSGKTEAAITLVSRMMSSEKAAGCFIGLPTMATANAMYERMGFYYRKLFSDRENPSIVLSHGSRHMSKSFRSSFFENTIRNNNSDGGIASLEIDASTYYCTKWLSDSTKKSLLADIGIGTIDQLLFGILPVRYQNLRLFGMRNKILVIDEVHAYDPYMNNLLCAVLKAHVSSGGSAVLLSATIPLDLKKRLVGSYWDGLGVERKNSQNHTDFPLLTKADQHTGITELSVISYQKNRYVPIKLIYHEEKIYSRIKEYRNEGICISWIRNTVYDVFDAYEKLKHSLGIPEQDIIIFHSRFAYEDRSRIEEGILKTFGKNSNAKERSGKVVIATQVIEQSLDLDFDVMISDLAPIELIIQRAGRLQRHNRGPRCKPIMTIYSPPNTDNPHADWYRSVFPKASYVYSNTAILWRTNEILKKEKALILPQKARYLIESVYGEKPISSPECFDHNEIESEGEKKAMEDAADFSKLLLKHGYSRKSAINEWDEDATISTRLSEKQSTVYIFRFDGKKILPYYGGDFPWERSSLKLRKGIMQEIRYTNNIDERITAERKKRQFRDDDIFLIAENEVRLGCVVHIENTDEIISYSSTLGLRIEKKNPT